MIPYLVSISSLTIKNTPTETPPNQATNQFLTSTDSIKKHPHLPKMQLSKAKPPQISTKLCNHNQHKQKIQKYVPIKKSFQKSNPPVIPSKSGKKIYRRSEYKNYEETNNDSHKNISHLHTQTTIIQSPVKKQQKQKYQPTRQLCQ